MAEGKFGPVEGFREGLFADGGEGARALVEEVVQALIGTEADHHFGALYTPPATTPKTPHPPKAGAASRR